MRLGIGGAHGRRFDRFIRQTLDRVRIVSADGRRISLGTYPTKRAADTAYARSVVDQADGRHALPSAVTTPTLAGYAPAWVESRLTKRGEPLRPRVRDLYASQLLQ